MRVLDVAKSMLGRGFLTYDVIAKEHNLTKAEATNVLTNIRSTKLCEAETYKVGKIRYVSVTKVIERKPKAKAEPVITCAMPLGRAPKNGMMGQQL